MYLAFSQSEQLPQSSWSCCTYHDMQRQFNHDSALLQVGSVHEQLGQPTPFLLRYAWVAGHAGTPGGGAPAASQTASPPEPQPPLPAEQVGIVVGDAHPGAEPAPASSWTGTSRAAAAAVYEGSTGLAADENCHMTAAGTSSLDQVWFPAPALAWRTLVSRIQGQDACLLRKMLILKGGSHRLRLLTSPRDDLQLQEAPVDHVSDIARQQTVEPAQPWLPDPAAVTQHRNEPAAMPLCAYNHHHLLELQPSATVPASVAVAGRAGPLHLPDDPDPEPASWAEGLMPPLRPSAAWQEQASSLRPPGNAGGLMHEALAVSTASLPSEPDADLPPRSRPLMRQPSLAAWVPPDKLMGSELRLLQPAPCRGGRDPFDSEGQHAELPNVAQSPPACHTGERSPMPAERGIHVFTPAATLSVSAGLSARQVEIPARPDGSHLLPLSQSGRAGAPSIFAPMGASMLGNEDSLCAFLGGWQRASAAHQPDKDLAISGQECGPLPQAGGCMLPVAQQGAWRVNTAAPEDPQDRSAAPPPGRLAAATAHARPGSQQSVIDTVSVTAAEGHGHRGEADRSAGQRGLPSGVVAEQLLHAEGESFWRCLLGVVSSYRGGAAVPA